MSNGIPNGQGIHSQSGILQVSSHQYQNPIVPIFQAAMGFNQNKERKKENE